jgi:hypothetical protein
MTDFVPQNPHAPLEGAAFRLEHLGAFQPRQPGMGQVERDGRTRHALGRKPLLAEPEMRAKTDLSLLQFLGDPLDALPDRLAVESQAQVAQAHVQQPILRPVAPYPWRHSP